MWDADVTPKKEAAVSPTSESFTGGVGDGRFSLMNHCQCDRQLYIHIAQNHYSISTALSVLSNG